MPLYRRILAELRPRLPALGDGRQFLEWLGNGYKTRWDELVPALALITVAAYLALGARPSSLPAQAPEPAPDAPRLDGGILSSSPGWAGRRLSSRSVTCSCR